MTTEFATDVDVLLLNLVHHKTQGQFQHFTGEHENCVIQSQLIESSLPLLTDGKREHHYAHYLVQRLIEDKYATRTNDHLQPTPPAMDFYLGGGYRELVKREKAEAERREVERNAAHEANVSSVATAKRAEDLARIANRNSKIAWIIAGGSLLWSIYHGCP